VRDLGFVELFFEQELSNSSHTNVGLHHARNDLRQNHERKSNYVEECETDKSG